MTVQARELYRSSSGDKWSLIRNSDGQLCVRHEPNPQSGGRASDMNIGDFLIRSGNGPEQQELMRLIGTLVDQ